jgi:hypothetical protein
VRSISISISEQLIKPLIEAFYRLTQQYMTTEKAVKIIGVKGIEYKTVTQSDILGDWDFIPKVMTDVQNKITIRENLLNMLGTVAKAIPQMPAVLVPAMYKLMKKIYEYHDFRDGAEIFPSMPTAEGGIDGVDEAGIGGQEAEGTIPGGNPVGGQGEVGGVGGTLPPV